MKVCSIVNADMDLPNLLESTKWRIMLDLGFLYKKHGRNSLLIERDDIIVVMMVPTCNSWTHKNKYLPGVEF